MRMVAKLNLGGGVNYGSLRNAVGTKLKRCVLLHGRNRQGMIDIAVIVTFFLDSSFAKKFENSSCKCVLFAVMIICLVTNVQRKENSIMRNTLWLR